MERKFKVTIGEKTFMVTIEEISEAAAPVTPPTLKPLTKPPVEEKPLEAVPVKRRHQELVQLSVGKRC